VKELTPFQIAMYLGAGGGGRGTRSFPSLQAALAFKESRSRAREGGVVG
jgi:hypothetical protein